MHIYLNTVARSRNVLYLLGYSNSLILCHSKRALLWRFNVAGDNQTYVGLHVKCPVLLQDFKQIFVEVPNVKFDLNPSSGSRA
jgi:hypothetical protein